MIVSKQLIVSMISFSAALPLAAQVKKTTTPTHKTHATAAKTPAALKNEVDSVSYAIGLSVAKFYKQANLTNINTVMLVKAINDVRNNGKLVMNEEQANTCMTNFMHKAQEERSAGNKKIGEEFLAANKSKPGVVTLPSGLQYMVLKEGTGPKPGPTDKVKVHYHGTLIDGRVFDSSVDRGQPIELSVNGVIPGWTEALQLMPVGSKWKLFIPSNLAYGDQQAGPLISPGSTLIFEVELLDIVK
ncbi:MAG TPA: FKBP-type peptidyl-prolyl cis-trans isomerase [Puia sp.]|nr:FKBP-type peptidyl-prolyl cis-trans isomerase [Puia sp.]